MESRVASFAVTVIFVSVPPAVRVTARFWRLAGTPRQT
jgi:hypothetical protein